MLFEAPTSISRSSSLAFIFLAIEIFSVNMITIWFSLGCMFAFVCSLFHLGIIIQFITFALISFLGLVFFKNKISTKVNDNIETTNFENIIGKQGIVTTEINNKIGQGRILVDGEDWRAISDDNSILEVNSHVIVIKMESTKLYVKRIKEEIL